MTQEEPKAQYEALYDEYQDVMHRGAWKLGWSFFFTMVGLLPMMYVFIWIVGPTGWERTFMHTPKLMWLAAPLNLGIVLVLGARLWRRNLELDATKRSYLARLKELKKQLPLAPPTPSTPVPEKDWEGFRDDGLEP